MSKITLLEGHNASLGGAKQTQASAASLPERSADDFKFTQSLEKFQNKESAGEKARDQKKLFSEGKTDHASLTRGSQQPDHVAAQEKSSKSQRFFDDDNSQFDNAPGLQNYQNDFNCSEKKQTIDEGGSSSDPTQAVDTDKANMTSPLNASDISASVGALNLDQLVDQFNQLYQNAANRSLSLDDASLWRFSLEDGRLPLTEVSISKVGGQWTISLQANSSVNRQYLSGYIHLLEKKLQHSGHHCFTQEEKPYLIQVV